MELLWPRNPWDNNWTNATSTARQREVAWQSRRGITMARIDAVLRRMDLKKLEALLERRRQDEERRLQDLLSRKRKLESELAQLDRSLGQRSGAVRGVRGMGRPGRPAGRTVGRRPNARRLNKISLGDAIVQIMNARSKPVHYKDLTSAIERRGLYKTRSKNLLSTVAVTLKRDRRFRKVEPGIYALRKK